MIVKEIIEQLQKMPQDQQVWMRAYFYNVEDECDAESEFDVNSVVQDNARKIVIMDWKKLREDLNNDCL